MTEVRTPQNQNPEQNGFTAEEIALIERLRAEQKTKPAEPAAPDTSAATDEWPQQLREETTYHRLSAEDRVDMMRDEKKPFWTMRRAIAAAALLAVAAGGVIAGFARSSGTKTAVPSPQPTAAAPVDPTPSETLSASPTPSESETTASVESDEPVAERYLGMTPEEFNDLSRKEAMVAIDYRGLTEPAYMYQFQSSDEGRHYNKDGKLVSEKEPYADGTDLYEFNPAIRAANPDTGDTPLDPQGILDTVMNERANVLSQATLPEDPTVTKLDKDMAARMMRGLYYNVDSSSADRFWKDVDRRKETVKITSADRPKFISMSDTVRTSDFGDGAVDYFIINYSDQTASRNDAYQGNRYMVVTPYDSEVNAKDPYGLEPGVHTISGIRHYLIIEEGKGLKDPNEAL